MVRLCMANRTEMTAEFIDALLLAIRDSADALSDPDAQPTVREGSKVFLARIAPVLLSAAPDLPSPTAGLTPEAHARATIRGAAAVPEGREALAALGYVMLPSGEEAKR